MGFCGGLAVACNVAVNCFYMISGFFIKEEETIANCKRRIFKIYTPTWIYSVLLPLLGLAFGQIALDAKSIVFLGLPFLSNQYWFATCYIAITAVLPFLAMLLRQLKEKEVTYLLCVLLFLDCIQPILGINAFSNIGYGLLHALTMYILGYWIKRNQVRLRRTYSILLYLGAVVVIIAVTLLSMKLTGDRHRTIADYNSPLMVAASFGFFMTFLSIPIKTTFFSRLAPYVFGVYLLNDNPHMRQFLWQKVFRCSEFYSSNWLIVHSIASTLLFTVVALGIEFVRQQIGSGMRRLLPQKAQK